MARKKRKQRPVFRQGRKFKVPNVKLVKTYGKPTKGII